MKKLCLTKGRPIVGQSFKGAKRVVVPNQSMTLQEIIKRFMKKESLPAEKQGVYNEEYDIDLEKLDKADMVEKDQMIDQLKEKVKVSKKKLDDEAEAVTRAKVEKKHAERKAMLEEIKKQSDPISPNQP